MSQTVIVKGRVFSVDDTLANQIEHECTRAGSELKLDMAKGKKEEIDKRLKEEEEAAEPRTGVRGR